MRIGVAKGKNDKHVFNRRLKRPDGRVVMNWIDIQELQDCIDDGVVDADLLVLNPFEVISILRPAEFLVLI